MTIFRKLLAEKERAQIYRILKILSRHAQGEEAAELKKIKKGLRRMERNGIALNLGTDEQPDIYSPKRIWDTVINSDIFHSAIEGEEALHKLRTFGPFFFAPLVKFVTDVSKQSINLAEVIKYRRYFD